jgi:tetratricopeptide (TPR) repeat protein
MPAKKPVAVRHIMRPALRVAASIIILLGAFGVYKYSTVNSSNIVAEYYTPYELNRIRGEANANALENAYNNKDWNAVISLVNTNKAGSKELFLAGAAYLELNQPAKAVDMFNQLLAYNQQTQSNYFQDDAEYYLALSYISNNQPSQAIPILKKIRADKAHLYHEKAGKISMLDLQILSWKK